MGPCGSWTTTTGGLDPSIGSTIDFFYNVGSPAGCRDLRTFGPGDVTGRYLVNVRIQQDGSPSVCIGAPQCTVTVNPATLPASCSTPVTPIVDPVTPTGESWAMESNTQNKDECSGDTDAANGVSIVIARDADKVSASPSEGVNVGDLVTIRTTNSKFRATTELDIVGAMGTQSLNIHTSCSDDLIVGQSFGAFRLMEFIPEGGIVTSTELSE